VTQKEANDRRSFDQTQKETVEPLVVSAPGSRPHFGVAGCLSELLHEQGLVRSAGKFRWLVRFKGAARQIKAGEYQLSTGLRPGELLNKIIRGEVRLHQITFPEGYTLKQMAELLEASKLVIAERFIAAAANPPFVRSLDIPATSLEGYLFPDTYRFARGLPVKTVLRSFVTMFNQHFGPVQEEKARKLGFTRHQVVILASVVEKETAAADERPLIAGVFLNRLRRRKLRWQPHQSPPSERHSL
jgi:UPF0755 protein